MHVFVHLTNVLSFIDDVMKYSSLLPYQKGPRAISKWHIVCRRSWYIDNSIISFIDVHMEVLEHIKQRREIDI